MGCMAVTKPRSRPVQRKETSQQGGSVAEPATEPRPAPPALTGITRVCSFCMSRQDLSRLAQVADSLQCADTGACSERAAASGIYPQREDEQALAARLLSQGAPA